MPAAAGAKRVKNTRIERPFIIGSEAWPLDDTHRKPNTPADHTKGWRVYVRAPEGQPDITRWLRKVQFKIFHTYPNPQRVVETPPFEIEETGWGGFNVDIRLFFTPEVSSKPEYRTHFLQLEPYGDEAKQARQAQERLVRSEFLDYIEFNEPTETLFESLTDEVQFPGAAGAKKAKGKGKAAAAAAAGRGDDEAGIQLPEASTASNPFSRETEAQILESLKKAEAEIEVQLQLEKEREQKAHTELLELRTQVNG